MTDYSPLLKPIVAAAILTVFWSWETWRPCFGFRGGRRHHALLNLGLALFNSVVLGLLFGAATAGAAIWAERHQFGLLHHLDLSPVAGFLLALLLLDGWMYLWHRANHVVPILWRFHRMHHADRHVDVTTATRFHLGEHLVSAMLRLGLVPVLGLDLWHVLVYETLVVAVTQLHHADIDLGKWDAWLRMAVVTPAMHKVHHSEWQPETDSNFATVLSIWDRAFGSFRIRSNLVGLVFGLPEFRESSWQTWSGMWKMPFVSAKAGSQAARPPRRLVRITFF